MLRIATTADIHYRPKNADEVFASLDTLERESRERKVDLISISGDIFHSAVLATGDARYPEFIKHIRRLADVAPVVMIYGTPSHDIAGSLDVFESLESFDGITILRPGEAYYYSNRHVWIEEEETSEETKLLIFGIPEPSKGWLLAGQPAAGPAETAEAMRTAMRSLLLGLAAQRKEHPDIPCLVLYHGQIRGATMDNGQVVENAIGRDDLAMIGADYYALGDIHAPQQIGDLPMYYPGSAYPLTWGETHQAGFNVVTFADNLSDNLLDTVCDKPVTVERVDYPHPQRSKYTLAGEELLNLSEGAVSGRKVWIEVVCLPEDKPGDDEVAEVVELMHRLGALPGSKITVNITPTETVRSAEIATVKRLREKVKIYADNSQQSIADTVLEKADTLEAEATDAGHTEGAWLRFRKMILRGAIGIKKGLGLDEITVDLDQYESGLIGLTWPNGRGKTTLIDSFQPWPAMPSRPGKLSLHFFLRDSFKDLYFVDERTGDEYRALIQINGTSKTGDADYLLYRNGDPITNGRKEPYLAAIDELFGGMDLYLRSAFVSQKDTGLADATKGERKTLFVELAGLDYLTLHADSAKARAKTINDDLARDAGWIAATEDQLTALPGLRVASDEKQRAISGGEEAVSKHDAAVVTAQSDHDAMQSRVAYDRDKRNERDAFVARQDEYDTESETLLSERGELSAAVAGCDNAEKRIADWEELEDERKTLEAQKAVALAEHTTALESYNVQREGYDSDRRAMEADKRDADATLSSLVHDIDESESALTLLDGLLDKPRHDTCPECGSSLPWAEGEEEQREKWSIQREQNLIAISGFKSDQPAVQELADTIGKNLAGLVAPVAPEQATSPEATALNRIYDDQLELNVEAARDLILKSNKTTARIALIDERRIVIMTTQQQIGRAIEGLLSVIDDALPLALTNLANTLATATEERTTARETLAAFRAEAGAISKQIGDLETKVDELAERLEAAGTKRRDAAEWSWLQKACGPDGIQALELSALAPSIEDVANRLLRAAYGSRFSIRFETTRMDATGKRQLEDFLILIADSEHGDEQELSTLSGGEAVWIKRALYDAFGIIRARNTGLKFLTVMQDESDGALDPEHREQYARMLEAAHTESGRYHTIMITHSAEVQAMLSQRIEVGGTA